MRLRGILSHSPGRPESVTASVASKTSRSLHLARRFFASLSPTPLDEQEIAWVGAVLSPAELALFDSMPLHDRRHAIDVARRVDRSLAGTPHEGDRRWMLAALLHDVGKAQSGLGIPGRVVATLVAAAWGRQRVAIWACRTGMSGRIGLYIDHPAQGEELILVAGGPREAAAWARLHQDDPGTTVRGMPGIVGAALVAADDD